MTLLIQKVLLKYVLGKEKLTKLAKRILDVKSGNGNPIFLLKIATWKILLLLVLTLCSNILLGDGEIRKEYDRIYVNVL